MDRKRTVLELDASLLEAVAERAARTGLSEREVFEEALRRYLGLESIVRRIQARGDLEQDESVRLAHEELDAVRAERRARGA